MPCCKTEKYGWCKDLPVVDYKDEEGKEYCVFHAPQGKKGVSVEEFNKLVFERINEAKKEGRICNLSGTTFEGDISFIQFNEHNPLPPIMFSGTEFRKGARFYKTIFDGKVDFDSAKFIGEADFFEATFSGITNFGMATFNRKADFTLTIFSGHTEFWGTTFDEVANFAAAKFSGEVLFVKTTFNGKTDFFDETFKDKGYLIDLNIREKVKLEKVNLQKVSFIDTDLRKVDFINCEWPEKFGRVVLYDELLVSGNKNNKIQLLFIKDFAKKVEILYRMLKQKYKEEHNEPEVSNWHYGEKEMFRKGSLFRRYFPFSLSNLYWLSSGYGERPLRSGMALFLLIIAISVLFGLTGIKTEDDSNLIEIKQLTNIWNIDYLVATLQYATFETRPDFISVNSFLKIAAKLLIPLQTALFALAVRNGFRR